MYVRVINSQRAKGMWWNFYAFAIIESLGWVAERIWFPLWFDGGVQKFDLNRQQHNVVVVVVVVIKSHRHHMSDSRSNEPGKVIASSSSVSVYVVWQQTKAQTHSHRKQITLFHIFMLVSIEKRAPARTHTLLLCCTQCMRWHVVIWHCLEGGVGAVDPQWLCNWQKSRCRRRCVCMVKFMWFRVSD